jgi:hypothetical protein
VLKVSKDNAAGCHQRRTSDETLYEGCDDYVRLPDCRRIPLPDLQMSRSFATFVSMLLYPPGACTSQPQADPVARCKWVPYCNNRVTGKSVMEVSISQWFSSNRTRFPPRQLKTRQQCGKVRLGGATARCWQSRGGRALSTAQIMYTRGVNWESIPGNPGPRWPGGPVARAPRTTHALHPGNGERKGEKGKDALGR